MATSDQGTSQLIEALRAKAASVLGSALSTPLVGFTVGANGNFPYYWQNPSNLQFNNLTYSWINTNLAANTTPVQQDETFTGLYISALGSIVYSLSSADQTNLNTANDNATNQQAALLNAWKSAYGSIPAGTATQAPIDIIVGTIATTWAVPPTTLTAMQNSKNLNKLLNNTPASGKPIIPVLANWLNAVSSAISLVNAVTMNNQYVATALDNVQNPLTTNGGLALDNSNIEPSYQISPVTATILNGLKASNPVTATMTVTQSSSSQFQVSVQGGAAFSIPVTEFLTIDVGGNASYFQQNMASQSNSTSITMTFNGVTLVNFGPTTFDLTTGLGWYWAFPITQAITNGTNDVSGFKFSPNPNIDFSSSGPFGYLTGVAISNFPTISITVTGSNYQSIQKTFQSSASAGVSFLGIPLVSASGSNYSSSATSNSSSNSVTVTLSPPAELVSGGGGANSLGWILGVQTLYPGATS